MPKTKPSAAAGRNRPQPSSGHPQKSLKNASTKSGGSGPSAPAAGGVLSKKARSNQRKSGGALAGLAAKPKINYYEQQKLDRIREKDERKANKEERLLLRKKERTAKLKILTRKTRKGQPMMGGRMELLLQQIQKSCQK